MYFCWFKGNKMNSFMKHFFELEHSMIFFLYLFLLLLRLNYFKQLTQTPLIFFFFNKFSVQNIIYSLFLIWKRKNIFANEQVFLMFICMIYHIVIYLQFLVNERNRGDPVDRALSSGPERLGSSFAWRNTAMYTNGTWFM